MDIRLRPLRDEELPTFIEASRADYVEGMVAHARMPEDFARGKAEHDLAEYLGAGSIPAGHGLYWIEDGGERVGRLWFAERPSRRVGRLAWLYELEIDEPFRGRGYGRRATALLEEEVKARGITEIQLNVWGGNEAARSLYRSQGYFDRAVEMAKELG
jgi:ribosomal protein S18 acetylase RimI-like enzyme